MIPAFMIGSSSSSEFKKFSKSFKAFFISSGGGGTKAALFGLVPPIQFSDYRASRPRFRV